MRNLCVLSLLLVLCISCGASGARQGPSLANLKDFGTIEKLMPFGEGEKPCPEQLYLRSLRDKLAETPISGRIDLLCRLTDETKWGAYQRFVACYVCAWYGVNYNTNRDYLVHCAFWEAWQIDPKGLRPFSFDDVGIDLLYALYEHNQDFEILHDILTTQGDAGIAELIVCLTDEAVAEHPRGVLHVAEISKKGFALASDLLHLPLDDDNHPLRILGGEGEQKHLNTFRIYVTRVAADPKDPLCTLAKELLKKPTRRNR